MNKLITILIALIFLNNCSFNENSRIWKNNDNKLESDKNIKKIFENEESAVSELNKNLKLDLSKVKFNNKIVDNENNLGSQNYNGELNRVANFKFSKLDEVNQLSFKPVFLENGIIFLIKKVQLLDMTIIKKFYGKKIIIQKQKEN